MLLGQASHSLCAEFAPEGEKGTGEKSGTYQGTQLIIGTSLDTREVAEWKKETPFRAGIAIPLGTQLSCVPCRKTKRGRTTEPDLAYDSHTPVKADRTYV